MAGPLAWCGQSLREHLSGAALLALDPEGYNASRAGGAVRADRVRRLIGVTVKRASRILGVSDNHLVRDHLLLAICLHDVGKAHEAYQRILAEWCPRDEKRATTAGHELLSAWAAYHTLTTLRSLDRSIPQPLVHAAVLAVALHHSAKRSIDEAYHRLRAMIHHPDRSVVEAALDALKNCYSSHAEKLKVDREATSLIEAALLDSMEKPYPIAEVATALENTPLAAARASEVLLRALATIDSIDAYIARRGDTPPLPARRYIRSP